MIHPPLLNTITVKISDGESSFTVENKPISLREVVYIKNLKDFLSLYAVSHYNKIYSVSDEIRDNIAAWLSESAFHELKGKIPSYIPKMSKPNISNKGNGIYEASYCQLHLYSAQQCAEKLMQ